jgi:hypothetical protein
VPWKLFGISGFFDKPRDAKEIGNTEPNHRPCSFADASSGDGGKMHRNTAYLTQKGAVMSPLPDEGTLDFTTLPCAQSLD